MSSNKRIARIAGLMYLFFILFSFLADQLACFAMGDTNLIINKIMAADWLFRIGCISNLLSALFFLSAAWVLYKLLKTINTTIALLFLLLNAIGVAIQCLSIINLFAGLQLLKGDDYLKIFQADQLRAKAIFFINLYKTGFNIAQLFFGTWLFPLGFLVFKSRFLPRILGILLMIDCFAVLITFFQFFLFPKYEVISYPCLAISLAAELGLTLWLLIKGISNHQADNKAAVREKME